MSIKNRLEELFLRKKPLKLFMSIPKESTKYISVLSKEADCTYSHTVKILEELKKLGLIKFEKRGRIKFVSLTQDGKEVATIFEHLLRKFTSMR